MNIIRSTKQLFFILNLFLISVGLNSLYAADISHEQSVAIKTEIKQLVDDYGIYRDSLNAVGYASVFSEDGVFKFRGDTYQGRAILQKRIEEANQATVSMHMMSSSQINIIDENNATGIHYAEVYSKTPDESHEEGAIISVNGPVIIGKYSDKYVRTEQGWKISERAFKPVFNTLQ